MASIMFMAVLAFSGDVVTETATAEPKETKAPAHQVVAIYFHRTVRCPTCKRIGAMAEEAVNKGFEKEVKARAVVFRLVDFQDKKNAQLTNAYRVESPTLVVLNVFDGKTVCSTNLPKVWQLVGKPDEFRTYVHYGVVRYLKQSKEDAEKEREESMKSKESTE
jgi:hypothetical protein